MSRHLRLGAVATAAVVALAGCSGGDTPEIRTAKVGRADVVELVNAPASVVARAQATVTAPADATVAEVLVDDGESVVAGVPLLRLESPSATARLLQARAVQASSASLSAEQRLQALAVVASAQRTVDALLVKAPITGTVQLGGSGPSGSAGGLDALVGQLPTEVQGPAAAALGAGSDADGATTSVAAITRGVPVQQGTVVAVVFDLSELSLVAEVDETDVFLVKPGITAQAELDAVPGATYPATVRSVELAPTTSSRGGVTYRVNLLLAAGREVDGAAAPRPRPGMSAVVDLRVRSAEGAVAVPAAAVIRRGQRDAVWVVRDGRARAAVVTLGAQGDEMVEVRSGVDEGAEIVVRGADVVREGEQL